MKKTLFLSAILGAALCSSAFADTTTVTVAGQQYANTVVLTTTPVAQPTDTFTNVLFAKGSNQDMKVQNSSDNAWVTTLDNTKTLIVAPATAGSTTYNGARLWFDTGNNGDIVVNANIIAGGTNGSELRFWSKDGSHTILKGDITVVGDGLQIWQHHGTQYIEGALNAAGKNVTITGDETGTMLNLSGGASIGTLDTTANSASVTLCSTNYAGEAAKSTTYTIGNVIGNKLTVGAGTALTITEGIAGKVTNNGTLNFTGTVDVTATAISDEVITENANAYSTGRYSKEIATTGGTINAEGVTWTFNGKTATETALNDGTVSGVTETTKYYVNVGGDIDYTVGSRLADTTETTMITVGNSAQNTKINIGSGAELAKSRLTANAATKLSGSGLYIANSAQTLGSNITLADDWTGTVQLSGTLSSKANFYENAAKSASTLEMKGVTGWFDNWRGTIGTNFKITNSGNNAGWSVGAFTSTATDIPEAVYSGTWSGEGNFYANVSGSATNTGHMNYKYTGNISAWTGAFKSLSTASNEGSYVTLTFADNAKNVNIAIQNDGGILKVVADTDATFSKKITATSLTVNSGKTVALGSQDHAIGTLTIASGATVSATHGGGSGFVNNGDVTVNAGATLNLGGGSNDVLGWSGSSVTRSVTLLGESGNIAKMNINHTSDGTTTMVTNLNLNGHALIESSNNRVMNSFGTTITATGTDNAITMAMKLRKHLTVNVDGSESTLTLGAIGYQDDQHDANVTLTKDGAGLLTITGNIDGHYADGDVMTIHGDGAHTVISGATIGNVKLQDVTLNSNAHTLTNKVMLQNVALNGAITNNGTLALDGAMAVTMNDSTSEAGPASGNGYSSITHSAAVLSGTGTVSGADTATWTLNGNDATYNNGTLSYQTRGDQYYIVAAESGTSANDVTILHLNNSATISSSSFTASDYVDVVANKTFALTGSTITMTGDNGGMWLHNGSVLTLDNTSKLVVDGLTITGGSVSKGNNGKDAAKLGNYNSNKTHDFYSGVVLENSSITANSDLVRGYTMNGGSLTVKQADTEVYASLSATTALVVEAGASAQFTETAQTIGTLTLGAGANVTLGTDESHDATLTITGLNVQGNASIDANLVVNGGTMSFADGKTLTMGCSVTIGKGDLVTVELTQEMVTAITNCEHVVLFEDVESATLGSNIAFVGKTADVELNPMGTYSLAYDAATKTIYVAPEPATATLSLLALAALVARRKRH